MPATGSPLSLPTLRALLDRIIPEDDFPGALNSGVEQYVIRQLAGDCIAEAPFIALGLAQLDAEAAARGDGKPFAVLPPPQQEALLHDLETGRTATSWPDRIRSAAFFSRMIELAQEGYYADPANGGNREAVSWRMVGYDPRNPLPPIADARG